MTHSDETDIHPPLNYEILGVFHADSQPFPSGPICQWEYLTYMKIINQLIDVKELIFYQKMIIPRDNKMMYLRWKIMLL